MKYSPHISILLYEPYANESSQICPFPAGWTQFDSDHHQYRRLSSHSYSHKSVIFCILWINNYLLSYSEFAFLVEIHAATLRLQSLKTSTAGAGQSILLRCGTAGCAQCRHANLENVFRGTFRVKKAGLAGKKRDGWQ